MSCEPDHRVRYVPVVKWFGYWLPLWLPRGAYLDHMALICSGPDHHLCARGRLRGGTARVYGAQWVHACLGRSLHWLGGPRWLWRLCDAYARAIPVAYAIAIGGGLCARVLR